MTLIQKLKSVFGIASPKDRTERDVSVTVERESTSREGRDTRPPTSRGVEQRQRGGAATAESAAAETDATSGQPSVPTASSETADVSDSTGAVEADEPVIEEAEEAREETAEEPTDDAAAESVDVLKGIGPAYADRLADADVHTVGDLAAQDADGLAERTDISASRLQGWIDRAKER